MRAEEEVSARASSVINGTVAADENTRAVGAVLARRSGGSSSLVCTGTLIAPRAVLSAAHCFVLEPSADFQFSLAPDVSLAGASSVRTGRAVHVHPEFSITTEAGRSHDLAVLELVEPVDASLPAALPSAALAAQYLTIGASVDLVGYGHTSVDGGGDGVKNFGEATIVAAGENEFVVGDREHAVQNCVGDSGGPSLARSDVGAPPWVLGVVSRSLGGVPCREGAVHVRVDANSAWIESVLLVEDGGSAGCAFGGGRPGGSMAAASWLFLAGLGLYLRAWSPRRHVLERRGFRRRGAASELGCKPRTRCPQSPTQEPTR